MMQFKFDTGLRAFGGCAGGAEGRWLGLRRAVCHGAPRVALAFGAMLIAGCSDPAEGVHQSAATTAKAAGGETKAVAKAYVFKETSKIGFVGSKVTGSHEGGFNKFEGTLHVAGGKVVPPVEVKIDMASTWSDNNRLTGHLKNADFFDVPKFPTSVFSVTSIEGSGPEYDVTGNLELHGVTKSITFPATIQVTGEEATVKAEFAINRKDFEINYRGMANDLIRDNVVIKLDLQAGPAAGGSAP